MSDQFRQQIAATAGLIVVKVGSRVLTGADGLLDAGGGALFLQPTGEHLHARGDGLVALELGERLVAVEAFVPGTLGRQRGVDEEGDVGRTQRLRSHGEANRVQAFELQRGHRDAVLREDF